MFAAREDAILRARAISGGFVEQQINPPGTAADLEGIQLKLQSLLSKAGYEEQYLPEFCKKAAIMQLTAIALSLLLPVFIFIGPLKYLLIIMPATFLYLQLKAKISRRISNFEKDYTALLVALASAIRSGLDPIVALSQSSKLFQPTSEVSKAINKFNRDIERGVSEENAILNFASDIEHPDIDLFRSSFILARKQGSSIGECLHRLAKVTRQRQSFRRKVKAAVAMQKLSAVGISGCAVIIGIIQYGSNPKAMQMAMNHPLGSKILTAGIALIILGVIWMFKIARTKV